MSRLSLLVLEKREYLPAETSKELLELIDNALGPLFGLMRKLPGE